MAMKTDSNSNGKKRGTIVVIGLGGHGSHKSPSMPPKMGAGRPTKHAPRPSGAHMGQGEPDGDEGQMAGGPQQQPGPGASGFSCPNCGAPLNVSHGGGMGPEAA